MGFLVLGFVEKFVKKTDKLLYFFIRCAILSVN